MKTIKNTLKQVSAVISTLILLAFAAHAQSSKICSGKTDFTEAEKVQILEAHNKARAALHLAKLSWDCDLAKTAQEWANRGFSGHRPDNDFGENIFVASNPNTSPVAAVEKWMLEKPFWDNVSGVCQTGKVCTHFTQIVWKKTGKVGCGINRSAAGKWKTLVVCNYDPAGNTKGSAY